MPLKPSYCVFIVLIVCLLCLLCSLAIALPQLASLQYITIAAGVQVHALYI